MYNYNNNKIIAIGDIHGDYDVFIEILKMIQVIDSQLNWIGKSTYVIQMGDILDGKRPDVSLDKQYLNETGEIKLNNLILSLDSKAKKYGGRLISLLGNHELYPYYYYNDKSFTDKYVKNVDLDEYIKKYKVTRFKYYKPGYGKGAIQFGNHRPLILQLGKFLFCHGSLSTKFLELCIKNDMCKKKTNIISISKINKCVSNWLTGKSKKIPFFINEPDNINPLFNRELTSCENFKNQQNIDKVESIFKYFKNANYLVLGHSTHKNINTICNNTIYRIDIGISRAFGGTLKKNMKRIQALEIKQSKNKIKTNIVTPSGKIKII